MSEYCTDWDCMTVVTLVLLEYEHVSDSQMTDLHPKLLLIRMFLKTTISMSADQIKNLVFSVV